MKRRWSALDFNEQYKVCPGWGFFIVFVFGLLYSTLYDIVHLPYKGIYCHDIFAGA